MSGTEHEPLWRNRHGIILQKELGGLQNVFLDQCYTKKNACMFTLYNIILKHTEPLPIYQILPVSPIGHKPRQNCSSASSVRIYSLLFSSGLACLAGVCFNCCAGSGTCTCLMRLETGIQSLCPIHHNCLTQHFLLHRFTFRILSGQ